MDPPEPEFSDWGGSAAVFILRFMARQQSLPATAIYRDFHRMDGKTEGKSQEENSKAKGLDL